MLNREIHAGLIANLSGYLLALDDSAAARTAAGEAIALLAATVPTSMVVAAALEVCAVTLALDGESTRAARLSGFCRCAFSAVGYQRGFTS